MLSSGSPSCDGGVRGQGSALGSFRTATVIDDSSSIFSSIVRLVLFLTSSASPLLTP